MLRDCSLFSAAVSAEQTGNCKARQSHHLMLHDAAHVLRRIHSMASRIDPKEAAGPVSADDGFAGHTTQDLQKDIGMDRTNYPDP